MDLISFALGVESPTVSLDTFEFAQWFWLSPSTMTRPTVTVSMDGRFLSPTWQAKHWDPLAFSIQSTSGLTL